MPWPLSEQDLEKRRRRLMDEIRRDASETAFWTGREEFSPRVMEAMEKVDRRLFLPEEEAEYAYVNRPLPIGRGQTISQPYIVALMTDLLDIRPSDRVLEIGTGSGYQTAVLARLAGAVFSIERLENLAAAAATRLQRLGYAGVRLRNGDGFQGWPEAGPFDGIILTAAPERLPQPLIQQLAGGGRLVAPIGRPSETQMLVRCVKGEDGKLDCRKLLPVSFVPMVARAIG